MDRFTIPSWTVLARIKAGGVPVSAVPRKQPVLQADRLDRSSAEALTTEQ
jgi:hypothetical protein